MSIEDLPRNPLPLWVKLLIIVCCLPLAAYPWLLSASAPGEENKWLLYLYPIAVILYAICAWKSWARRPELTWILLIMLLLTHAALWALAYL